MIRLIASEAAAAPVLAATRTIHSVEHIPRLAIKEQNESPARPSKDESILVRRAESVLGWNGNCEVADAVSSPAAGIGRGGLARAGNPGVVTGRDTNFWRLSAASHHCEGE
jgi:hypothetical protein